MTPLTFEAAKAMVPEYIMLKAGDKWARGDEYYQWSSQEWENADDMAKDSMTVIREQMGRRTIPEEVRDAMARKLMQIEPHSTGVQNQFNPFESWLLEQSP